MTKTQFIEEANKRSDELNDMLQEVLQETSLDFKLDWRDDKELEIHFNDNVPQEDGQRIVDTLQKEGFGVDSYDWRYDQTLRIHFKDSYWGSFGLEDYDEEEWNEFIEAYDIMINE